MDDVPAEEAVQEDVEEPAEFNEEESEPAEQAQEPEEVLPQIGEMIVSGGYGGTVTLWGIPYGKNNEEHKFFV